MNGEPFFDFWRGGKAVFFFQKIYFRMAGHFLISRGVGKLLKPCFEPKIKNI